jgi:hypothetical protein
MKKNSQKKSARNTELIFLIVLFCLSFFLRWFRLDHNLFFGFEQGRDAQIIQDIYTLHQFKLVGPKTDLPGVFHGAYYYYLLIVPYALTHGNPLAASFFLIFLSSFISVGVYFFAKSVFHSAHWAGFAAIFATVSYEYIIYARWLSNVTPAIPLILMTYYFLWMYREKKKSFFFLLAAVTAACAAQFEVVLVLLFGCVFLTMIIGKIIPRPNWKIFLLSVFCTAALFTPHVIYNFRNQNILVNSILGFAQTSATTHSANSLVGNARQMTENYSTLIRKSLSLPRTPISLFVVITTIAGILFSLKRQKNFREIGFFLVWFLMCVPVIFFHDVARLTQLYLGVGLSLIFLWTFAARELNKIEIGRLALCCAAGMILFGWWQNWQNLANNRDVFFITIQEGLNYGDQQRLLRYVHDDAHGQTYRFAAFTIPYLQPEGWQYLRHYLYPADRVDDGSKLLYIAIEKQVEPFWRTKWVEDFGPSTLVEEKTFGLLTVQKYLLK